MQFITRTAKSIVRDFKRAWAAGAGFIAISRWTSGFTGIFRRILLAQLLGTGNIGHIAVVSAVLSVIRLPAGDGTFPVITKLVAENMEDGDSQKRVMGTALRITTVTSVVAVVALLAVLMFSDAVRDAVAKKYLYVLAVFVPFMIYTGLFRCGLMGQRRMKAVAKLDMVTALGSTAVVVALAWLLSLNGWFLGHVITIVAGLALFAWSVRHILSLQWDRTVARRVATIGSFSFLTHMLGVAILQVDTLTVAGILQDPALTGIYNTASMALNQLNLFTGSILVVTFPFVAQNRNNLPLLRERYLELQKKLLLLSLALVAVSWIAAPLFFPVFGADFSAATGPFRVLVFGLVARTLYRLDNIYLEALGRTDVLFVVTLISTAIIVGANVYLIPKHGVDGAAWATTLSMFAGMVIRWIAVQYFIFFKKAIR